MSETTHLPFVEDIAAVGMDVIHDEAGVTDDEPGFFPLFAAAYLLQQATDDFSDQLQTLEIHPRFGFIQKHQQGSCTSNWRSSERFSSPPEKP